MNRAFSIIARHWKALVALNVVLLTSVYALKLVSSSETWIANTKLIIPETSSKLDANLGALGSIRNENVTVSQLVNPRDLQISILTSDVVMQRVLLNDPEKEKFEDIDDFKVIFEISPIEGTTGFQIYTNSSDKDLALTRLSLLINTFNGRLHELRVSEGNAQSRFSEDQLAKSEYQLNLAKEKLVQFQESSGVVDADIQIQNLLKAIDALQAQYDQAVLSALTDANQVEVLEERIGLSSEDAAEALGLDANSSYQYVRQQLTETSSDLAKAKALYTNEAPQVRLLIRRQQELEVQLQQLVNAAGLFPDADPAVSSGAEGRRELIQQMILLDSQANAQQHKAAQVEEMIDELTQSLNSLPKAKIQLQSLQREYSLAEGVYKGLVAQTQQSNLNAFTAYPNIQVLDPPTARLKPTSWLLVMINAVIASILGSSALLLFLESRDPLLTPDDLKDTHFDLVVEIPRLPYLQDGLYSDSNSTSPLPIDFQWLGSAVTSKLPGPTNLLITSADFDEGKTTITLGLADSLSAQGFSVLVVGLNQGRQQYLNLKFCTHPEKLVEGTPSAIKPNLDLMLLNGLSGSQLQGILQSYGKTKSYDYIIFDGEPISHKIDALLISQFVSNVFFVVKPGLSKKNLVRQSIKQLKHGHITFLGLVVNEAAASQSSYSTQVPYQDPTVV